jgi:hypothetical protein
MREVRARIAQRHGIDLSAQQIQELAARRLEAILDPRTLKPSLLEQLRKSAGDVGEPAPNDAASSYVFEDTTLYESHNATLRFVRRLLNPLLKLFFNPNPLIHALNAQARLNAEHARREEERDRRQAEWNALHYSILQRLVLELSRTTVDAQGLASRVESTGARVDFNDRRLRALETSPAPTVSSASAPRPAAPRPAAPPRPPTDATVTAGPTNALAVSSVGPPATGEGSTTDVTPDGVRRRRRRRRGRRSGAPGDGSPAQETAGQDDGADSNASESEADQGGHDATDSESQPTDIGAGTTPNQQNREYAMGEPLAASEPPTERDSSSDGVTDDATTGLPQAPEASPTPSGSSVEPADR